MTQEETKRILTLIQCEWPQSFAKMDNRMMAAKLALWADEFKAEPYETVYAAVRTILSAGGREFAPGISLVRETISRISQPQTLTEGEAWALVSKACANGVWGYAEEYAKLPHEVQAAVGRPEQLKKWAMVDSETLQSVIASNFQRSYRTVKQREKENARLPQSVRDMIGGLADRMRLEAHLD